MKPITFAEKSGDEKTGEMSNGSWAMSRIKIMMTVSSENIRLAHSNLIFSRFSGNL